MSGLLRRIKRSRTADAGEPLPEGQAAAPEGAAPATEPPAAVPGPAEATVVEKPVLLADPDVPAGVDPVTAPLRPPAGRRGRLRRRLRYLRRARELMLRDLGGLLYEIHRSGGGNLEAHGNLIRGKVQRIASLDAEAHALESALGAPRAGTIVFEPGIGGACVACGELYGSAARFCEHCGTPTVPPARGAVPPEPVPPEAAPAPATRESVFGGPADDQPTQALSPVVPPHGGSGAPADPDVPTAAPAAEEAAPQEQPTAELAASGAAPAAEDDDATIPAADPRPHADPQAPGATDDDPEAGRNPFPGIRNGRADEHTPPERSSGDPLGTREPRP